jgi:hypothetical protein
MLEIIYKSTNYSNYNNNSHSNNNNNDYDNIFISLINFFNNKVVQYWIIYILCSILFVQICMVIYLLFKKKFIILNFNIFSNNHIVNKYKRKKDIIIEMGTMSHELKIEE